MEWLNPEIVGTLMGSLLGVGIIVYSLSLVFMAMQGERESAKPGEDVEIAVAVLRQQLGNLEGWMKDISGRLQRLEERVGGKCND